MSGGGGQGFPRLSTAVSFAGWCVFARALKKEPHWSGLKIGLKNSWHLNPYIVPTLGLNIANNVPTYLSYATPWELEQ